MTTELPPLRSLLRCLECGGPLDVAELIPSADLPDLGPDGRLRCTRCGEEYPVIGGTPRMLPRALRERLADDYPRTPVLDRPAGAAAAPLDAEQALKHRTGASFAYEWRHFGDDREEWKRNFLDYVQPHEAASFRDRLVVDVGTGSGRHSEQAARLGAQVVAVDIGTSIDVARRNLPPDALTVQADAEQLPFDRGAFDFVMSLGVLHHLPHPERALARIARLARPGGIVHVYVYWKPPVPAHRTVLRGVSAVRRVTARLPHRVLHALCYPVAAVLYAGVVVPYRLLRGLPGAGRLARLLPLKTYADYPFGVLVNDQFDRFSAPLEHRYTADEVREMLTRTGLVDVQVLPNAGWVGDARVPDTPSA